MRLLHMKDFQRKEKGKGKKEKNLFGMTYKLIKEKSYYFVLYEFFKGKKNKDVG